MGGNSDGVKLWLRSRHISVLDEWVEACIEWIHEEHQGTVLSASQLCKMVYEQWLDSDLTEIATPCLPPGINQAKKTQLKGSYALQVNCIQDISSPAYAQLIKLQGRENENALVSAAPTTQGRYEPPSSRMLMLSLTDGQETIQAMEYKPVPCLTSNLNPGAKIMLSGDMQCRLGVILLTPTHVKVLGGEVETLKETNSQEKILARAIGVTPPDRPVGSNDQQQTTSATTATATTMTGNTTNTTTTTTRQSTISNTGATRNQEITTNHQQRSNQHQTQHRNTSNKAPVKQEPYIGTKNSSTARNQGLDQGHSRSNQHIKPTGQPKWNQGQLRPNQDSKPVVHQGWNSGPSRSVQNTKPAGHQGHLKPNQCSKPAAQQGWSSGPSRSVRDTKPAGHQGHLKPNQGSKPAAQQWWNSGPSRSVQDTKPTGHQEFLDPFLDDEDDGLDELMLEELENMERKEAQKVNKTETAPSHDDWDIGDIDEEELLAMEWESSTEQMQDGQRQNNLKEQPHQRHSTAVKSTYGDQASGGSGSIKQFSSVGHSLFGKERTSKLGTSESGSNRTSTPLGKTHLQTALRTSPTFASNVVPLFKREVKPPSASVMAQGHQRTVQHLDSLRTQQTKQEGEHGFGGGDRSVKQPVKSKMAVATRIIKAEPISQHDKIKKDVIQDSVRKTNVGTSSKVSERRDFISAQSLVKSEEEEHAAKRMRINSGPKCIRPFVYLIEMADQLKRKEVCRFDVKGFIMTLLSSLSHHPTWSLAAKINDGTLSLDVDISDKVLSELIGFTVAEMMEMKANMKKSGREKANEIKETIKQGIGRCQQSLMDLSCIMTIEMKPEYSRPLLVAVRQPTMEDCNALRQCLQETR